MNKTFVTRLVTATAGLATAFSLTFAAAAPSMASAAVSNHTWSVPASHGWAAPVPGHGNWSATPLRWAAPIRLDHHF